MVAAAASRPADAAATLRAAYAACAEIARSHAENFPVASRLLPKAMRPHVAAVYAFARIADDFADEGQEPPEQRRARLEDWQARLHAAARRDPDATAPSDPHSLVFVAVGHTVRSCDLPVSLFDDLLSAFAQDITRHRYASWAELLDYCRRSANPVGRLVLRIAGRADAELDRSSDALCTALQLTNFWQDFGRDWRAGRLYVPREVADACGAREADLAHHEMTDGWVAAIGRCVETTGRLFDDGRPVCDGVGGRLRVELRLTWLGGRRVLDRVQANRRSLLRFRPALGAVDAIPLLWQALRWRTVAA